MKESFWTKKIIFIVIIFLACAFFIYLSFFVNPSELRLVKGQLYSSTKVQYVTTKGGKVYHFKFLLGPYPHEVYKISGCALKYSNHIELYNEVEIFDSVQFLVGSGNEVYSFKKGDKEYINTKAVLKETNENHKFLKYSCLFIVLGSLPIFFFSKPPKFFHSGFEFEVRFRYVALIITGTAIILYFVFNGVEYLNSGRFPDKLKKRATLHSQKRGRTWEPEDYRSKKISCKLAERFAENTANLRDILPF